MVALVVWLVGTIYFGLRFFLWSAGSIAAILLLLVLFIEGRRNITLLRSVARLKRQLAQGKKVESADTTDEIVVRADAAEFKRHTDSFHEMGFEFLREFQSSMYEEG